MRKSILAVALALAFGSGWYARPLETCVVAGVTLDKTLSLAEGENSNCTIRNVKFVGMEGPALETKE